MDSFPTTCFFPRLMFLQENWAMGLGPHRCSLSSRIPACPALPLVLACLAAPRVEGLNCRLWPLGSSLCRLWRVLASRVEQVKAESGVPEYARCMFWVANSFACHAQGSLHAWAHRIFPQTKIM